MIEILGITSQRLREFNLLTEEGVIQIIEGALAKIDSRLASHGYRVAFLVYEMMRRDGRYSREEMMTVGQAALFHDVGAYKTDELNGMFSFEIEGVMPHAVYGYLFLQYFTPLGEDAKAVLYHHTNFNAPHPKADGRRFRYAQLLHLADRVDILHGSGQYAPRELQKVAGTVFDPELVELFLQADREQGLVNQLDRWTSPERREEMISHIAWELSDSVELAISYVAMLVYIIDFKSEATVDHTLNTIAFSVLLSRLMGMSEEEQYKIYLGAMLHDIGKIAIPASILEGPGKLTNDEMRMMQTHVVITDELLRGHISQEIRRISARHHEKLDGTGYPEKLMAADLTKSERIVAVADILSALVGQRSYKAAFSKERTVKIIHDLRMYGKLDPEVCQMAEENFDQLLAESQQACAPVLAIYRELWSQYDSLLQEMTEQ